MIKSMMMLLPAAIQGQQGAARASIDLLARGRAARSGRGGDPLVATEGGGSGGGGGRWRPWGAAGAKGLRL